MSSFTEEQSELLIDLVRQYPVLYNLKHKNYFNNTIKENAWKSICEALQKPVGECKTRWKTIRDSYRKQSKKLGRGSAAIRSKYGSEKLQLNSVAFQRGSKTNISFVPETQSPVPETQSSVPETQSSVPETQSSVPETQLEVPETQSAVLQNEFTQNTTHELPVLTDYFNLSNENIDVQAINSTTDADNNSECSSTGQLGTKRKKNDVLAEEMKKSRIQREMLINKFVQKKERERDPIVIFFEGVAATVKTFSPELIIETKLAVTKLVSEIELRASTLQRRATENYISTEEGGVYLQL